MTHDPDPAEPTDATPPPTGRRNDLRYEADPDHILRVRGTAPAPGPLPSQEQSAAAEAGLRVRNAPPVQDATVPVGPDDASA